MFDAYEEIYKSYWNMEGRSDIGLISETSRDISLICISLLMEEIRIENRIERAIEEAIKKAIEKSSSSLMPEMSRKETEDEGDQILQGP